MSSFWSKFFGDSAYKIKPELFEIKVLHFQVPLCLPEWHPFSRSKLFLLLANLELPTTLSPKSNILFVLIQAGLVSSVLIGYLCNWTGSLPKTETKSLIMVCPIFNIIPEHIHMISKYLLEK